MRKLAGVLALALIGAGCALPAGSGPRLDRTTGSRGYAPLRASIVPPGMTGMGGFNFHVDRPAYVAMFRIQPGYGTSMVYPSFGQGRLSGFVYAGHHNTGSMRTSGYRAASAYRTSTLAGRTGPRFYFLVASEEPLDMNRLQSTGMGRFSQASIGRFSSFNAYNAMDQLVEAAVPVSAPPGSWATDMYVEWPDVLMDEPGDDRVLLTCNGRTYYVPWAQVIHVQRTACLPTDQIDPGEGAPDDSVTVENPGRRPPVVTEPVTRERITEFRDDGTEKPSALTAPRPRAVPGGTTRARPESVERPSQRARPSPPSRPTARPAAPAARPASRPAAQPRSTPSRPASRPARETRPKCDPCSLP